MRIRQLAAEYGLPEPEFIESDSFIRVNLRRSSEIGGDSSEKFGDSSEINRSISEKKETSPKNTLNVTEQKILDIMLSNS